MGLYTYLTAPPSPYPPSVTKIIRRALYYESSAGNDPKQAVSYYLDAVEEATKLGIAQTSDELTGLKIKIAGVYEKGGRLDSAIRVYAGMLHELKSAMASDTLSDDERTRALRRAIGTSVKVGDLSILMPSFRDKAEANYVYAVEAMLRETQRRKGDDTWLNPEERGGCYEALATYYFEMADRKRPDLALPLYLKALESVPEPNCHSITLMNNIASSISTQSDDATVQENAFTWASRARDLVVNTNNEPAGQSECDLGRSFALYNLGMISEKRREGKEAKSFFEQAGKKFHGLGFEEGYLLASEALRRLKDL